VNWLWQRLWNVFLEHFVNLGAHMYLVYI
jgi:hypothetical protein